MQAKALQLQKGQNPPRARHPKTCIVYTGLRFSLTLVYVTSLTSAAYGPYQKVFLSYGMGSLGLA